MIRKFLATAKPSPESPTQVNPVVTFLLDPRTYAERPAAVELIETHISWVFLTSRYAYKLKKPVQFDFLDFSTPALRQRACLDELQLNRRLSPETYLEVFPITLSKRGRLQLNGDGQPIDWVLKMRRLPAERTLEKKILDSSLTMVEVDQIAGKLAEFYRRLPPLSLRTEDYRQHLLQHVQANLHQLSQASTQLDSLQVRRVHAAQLQLLRLWPEWFDNRVCDGRIVEGHGDLRPEHIYLTPPPGPTIIDCVEFNAEYRQLDVLDELSFLAMECDYLGAMRVSERLLEQYFRTSGDNPPWRLGPFYRCYRACVRAKVHALRAAQLAAEKAQASWETVTAYLHLADRYAATLGRPLLILVRGLTGVGKSTLAMALADTLGSDLLQTDAIRRELFPAGDPHASFGQGIYQPEHRQQVYDELLVRAEQLLRQRQSVILDGTFLTTELRERVLTLGERQRAAALIVTCYCPPEVAAERIAARRSAGSSLSESRPEYVRLQGESDQPDLPHFPTARIDTSLSVPAMLSEVLPQIRRSLDRANFAASPTTCPTCQPYQGRRT